MPAMSAMARLAAMVDGRQNAARHCARSLRSLSICAEISLPCPSIPELRISSSSGAISSSMDEISVMRLITSTGTPAQAGSSSRSKIASAHPRPCARGISSHQSRTRAGCGSACTIIDRTDPQRALCASCVQGTRRESRGGSERSIGLSMWPPVSQPPAEGESAARTQPAS